tara:strand:+ start:213 stop:773 length:561 start_codon:yes stop_codon:yes gene_type:complete
MSTLHVENLKGLSSGGNANKVIIPTGQTLEVTDNIRHDDMPTGSIIQTVHVRFTTDTHITGTSFVSIGSLSITPKFSNSKIHVNTTNHVYVQSGNNSTWRAASIKLLRDSTVVLSGDNYEPGLYAVDGTARFMQDSTIQYIDTANTTNALVYSVQYGRTGTNVTGIRVNNPTYGRQGFMLLQEIKQ